MPGGDENRSTDRPPLASRRPQPATAFRAYDCTVKTPDGSIDVHELFRYGRGDEVRVYSLHVVPGGTELWRVTSRPESPDTSVMECDFTDADAAARFLDEVQRTLTAGGWRPVGSDDR